ncbi:MAG: hypothetical protein CMF69_07210 [Magnetovibrio sp.]|nr:hypothetical protein [Magnetovibrio sp.]
MTTGLAIAALAIIYCMRLSSEIRANLALLISAVVFGVFSIQTIAIIFLQNNSDKIVPPQTIFKKVMELRDQGSEAYPTVFPWVFIRGNETVSVEGRNILPLSGIGGKRTVYCNETGRFLVYTADEYGFLNPQSAWQNQDIDVLLVGDSFAQGACVPPEDNIAAQLRRKVSTISIGMGGNGPLLMLAGLREFLSKTQAKTIMWLYFEGNDLYELEHEKKNSRLQLYLNKSSFRQNNWKHQKALNNFLINYAEKKISAQKKLIELKSFHERPSQRFIGFLMLRPLRNLIGLRASHTPQEAENVDRKPFNIGNADFSTFTRVLKRARDDVHGQGAKFIFIYLPDHLTRGSKPAQIHAYKKIVKIVERLKIPLLDMRAAFSVRNDLPLLFSCENCHYSSHGYAVVARAIEKFVSAIN